MIFILDLHHLFATYENAVEYIFSKIMHFTHATPILKYFTQHAKTRFQSFYKQFQVSFLLQSFPGKEVFEPAHGEDASHSRRQRHHDHYEHELAVVAVDASGNFVRISSSQKSHSNRLNHSSRSSLACHDSQTDATAGKNGANFKFWPRLSTQGFTSIKTGYFFKAEPCLEIIIGRHSSNHSLVLFNSGFFGQFQFLLIQLTILWMGSDAWIWVNIN